MDCFVNSVTVTEFGTINVFSSLVSCPMYPHSDLIDQIILRKLGIAFVHALAAFFPHGVLLAQSGVSSQSQTVDRWMSTSCHLLSIDLSNQIALQSHKEV